METEREMSRYEVTPIGIFLETWDGNGGIKRECIIPRDRLVEAYEKWIKNASTEKNDTKNEIKVGDVVRCNRLDNSELIVTRIYRDSGTFDGLEYNGSACFDMILDMWEKTGKHIDLGFIKEE